MKESSLQLKAKLEAIEAFVNSPAYKDFIGTFDRDLETNAELLLNGEPSDLSSLFNLLSLYGVRRQLLRDRNFFEDARVTLKNLIDEAVDEEIETRPTKQ